VTSANAGVGPEPGAQIRLDGHLVTVVAATSTASGADLVIRRGDGTLADAVLTRAELDQGAVPENDGQGNASKALAGLWARWMQHAIPRIRSAVLATRPLQPFAHQDEAVFTHMLPQPRLRYLLADEPGTGKTIMSGMYLAEGTRRGLLPGRAVIVVPAHLVEKWRRDLFRYFAIDARRLTPEIARDPAELDPRYQVWVVSVDLFTHNPDVRRRVAGPKASWSLAIFDEAHRLTPTSQYLAAARELASRSHHLLLLTATPHRGKEHFFRALLNLLDPQLYQWDRRATDYEHPLRPSTLSFLRRMKEDLKDLDGQALFKRRFAETIPVQLDPAERAAYRAVMDYVDTYYTDNPTLARSIYGKRTASSLTAARETLLRRAAALKGPADQRVAGQDSFDLLGDAIDDDDAWERAEAAVVAARTHDKQGELEVIDWTLETIRLATVTGRDPSKWAELLRLLDRHGIETGSGQLLVFTEFADTARWLADLFAAAGYTTETLEGAVGHYDRDRMQQDFLAGKFQVLVSTDAGGEGIDLQSAHVMVNWDIPWSLVRLEQRMGRLHRIGQRNDVFIYHLVSSETREGRVQEVMLENLGKAGDALGGRIFDLLDATADRVSFDYTAAMVAAQASDTAAQAIRVPGTDELISSARTLAAEERRLRSRADTGAAEERFRADRLEAINPVIVDGFVERLAAAAGWQLSPGPVTGLRRIRSPQVLPQALGGSTEALVAADGASVRQARVDGALGLDEAIVLGPTEPPFVELVELAAAIGAPDLLRGAHLVDTASLTGYTLLIYAAETEVSDDAGQRTRRPTPVLVRYSGAGAFPVAWEVLLKLTGARGRDPAVRPAPAARADGLRVAQQAFADEVQRERADRVKWVAKAREQLQEVEYRYLEELSAFEPGVRRERMAFFDQLKASRLMQLDTIAEVRPGALRLTGWVQVLPGAVAGQLGYDPDSESIAVHAVWAELDRLGFDIDDRQTAGLGYDLLARHRSGEQRLVEVKGLVGPLGPVWLEQNEWAQAQQRGSDYWLYVVANCATSPVVAVRAQDPAAQVGGPRRIQRYQIGTGDLRRMARKDQA
jgi:superfamily II DNA or RNA helicase